MTDTTDDDGVGEVSIDPVAAFLREPLADAMSRHAGLTDHLERADAVLADLLRDWPELTLATGTTPDPAGSVLTDLYRDGEPLTVEEFWQAAHHIWLNAMQCVRPTPKFAEDLGLMVIRNVMGSDIKTAPIGSYEGSRAVIIWVNAS